MLFGLPLVHLKAGQTVTVLVLHRTVVEGVNGKASRGQEPISTFWAASSDTRRRKSRTGECESACDSRSGHSRTHRSNVHTVPPIDVRSNRTILTMSSTILNI